MIPRRSPLLANRVRRILLLPSHNANIWDSIQETSKISAERQFTEPTSVELIGLVGRANKITKESNEVKSSRVCDPACSLLD